MSGAQKRGTCRCGASIQARSEACAHCTRMINMRPAIKFALKSEIVEVIDFLETLGPEWKEIPGALDLCYGIKNEQKIIRKQVEIFWCNAIDLGYDRIAPGVIIHPPGDRQRKST